MTTQKHIEYQLSINNICDAVYQGICFVQADLTEEKLIIELLKQAYYHKLIIELLKNDYYHGDLKIETEQKENYDDTNDYCVIINNYYEGIIKTTDASDKKSLNQSCNTSMIAKI